MNYGGESAPCDSGLPFAGKGYTIGVTVNSNTMYFQYGTGRYSEANYFVEDDIMYLYRQDISNQATDLLWRVASEGDYVYSETDNGHAEIYLTEDSEVYLMGEVGDGYDLYIIGTPTDNMAYISEKNARSGQYTEIGPAKFNFDGYLLESVTLTDGDEQIEITYDGNLEGILYGGIVPVSISTGSGGGSGGLSPTLVTMLSVVPILVLVGITLMVIRSMRT